MDLCIGKLEGRFVNCNVPAVNYYSSSCSVFFSCSSATDYIFSTLAQEIKMDGADTEVCRIICKLGHIHPVFFFLLCLFCLFIFSFVQGLWCVSGWSQRHTQEHEGGSLIEVAAAKIKFTLHVSLFLSVLVQDMDDMDADLFASKKKPSSAPAQTKPLVSEGPKKDSAVLESNAKPEGAGNSVQSVLA